MNVQDGPAQARHVKRIPLRTRSAMGSGVGAVGEGSGAEIDDIKRQERSRLERLQLQKSGAACGARKEPSSPHALSSTE